MKLYADHLAVRYAKKSAQGYLMLAKRHLDWLAAHGVSLVDVRREDILAYQTALLAMRKADKTAFSTAYQVRQVSVLKSLYGFLYKRSFLLSNPASALEYPHVEQRLPRSILTIPEARRLVEAPDTKTFIGLRDRAILETLYSTGIRAGELANLKLSDIDTEERVLRVIMGKGRKDRNVPLTRSAAEAVEAYLKRGRPRIRGSQPSPLLFLALRGGKMHDDTLNAAIALWAKKINLGKHITAHSLRHSAATHLLKGGADIRHIQKLLGHSSLQATERYTRVEISDLKEVLKRAHPRGR
jgi:integrase/recombinase XerD